MKYRLYTDRITLMGSHEVPKGRFKRELQSIRNLHPNNPLWVRSEASLCREWASHNLAYSLGINRIKSADCDLEYEPKWYMNFAYFLVGNIAMLFIK